ncbi:hypothetical protein FO519_005152 [Halicephalobus sp. NKZ332]|nr:hypothetical protein FO519_005152 [Halicephalobus sp. NKZ332]
MSTSEPLSTSAFYSADHVVDNQSVPSSDVVVKRKIDPETPEFADFFEIPRIVSWIKENNFQRVALQLPDAFLTYALPLASRIERESGSKIYVLADTSYRSCCIDAVAAEHATCDSLVHFGEACLSSPSEAIPVLYIYGKLDVDWADFESHLREKFDSEDQSGFVVLYEPGYDNVADRILDSSKKILVERDVQIVRLANLSSKNASLGRELPECWSEASSNLIFIGSHDSALLPIWLMTHTRFMKVYNYAPDEKNLSVLEPASFKQLRRRLFLIEKLRDANVVGLVVGTLGVGGIKEAISRIRKLCKEASKKLYVLSIGKVNEPKLSNFANDIDCFILLSCPFGIILDTNEFFKPIVSLFEAEIALNPGKEWFAGGGWTAEFGNFVKDEIGKQDIDKVDISLISGKIRTAQVDDHEKNAESNKQLLEYSAGNYFANRTWKGLDNSYVEEDLSLNEGLKGIAMEYKSEPTEEK